MNATKIKDALSLVHYYEHHDRGTLRLARPAACRLAASLMTLSGDETGLLLRVCHVDPSEVL